MNTKLETPPKKAKDVADMAQKSVDQAQEAFEKVSEYAHGNVQTLDAASAAFKSRAVDLQMKAIEIAQLNVNTAFAFARKAFAVKDPSEFIALNQEFARDQFKAFTQQVTEINQLAVQLSKDTVKPVQESLMKSWGDLSKSFAA